MTLILKHDEALNYLASLKTPIAETEVLKTQEKIPEEVELTNADKKRIAALKTTKPVDTKSKVYRPGKKRQKITQEHMKHLFKIADEKCKASSAIKVFADTYGYTLAYASSIVRNREGMRLVKGRDIPMSDRFPNTLLIGKEQYIRKMT
jgi:hypothetical protein